ncbi:ATP-binding protein [Micromonospora sp. LOL_024]|uniref:ATP-binding protein n=1 Tax=Micromonospora sp. LOL_024 TaxID=3345412 RepID=UPI003A8A85CA
MVVPHHASGTRAARRRLAAELADAVTPAALADLVAVLAELVGNAVRHAEPLPGGVVRVAWRLRTTPDGAQIRLQVTDGGAAGGPRLRPTNADAADGRGLHIVSGLASRWGVDRDGLGQSVWADFDPVPDRPGLVTTG